MEEEALLACTLLPEPESLAFVSSICAFAWSHQCWGWMAGGELRLDATIKYKPGGEDVFEAHGRWYAEGGWSGLLVEQ